MPVRKQGDRDGPRKIRADLESVCLTLADAEDSMPFIRLRVEQALRRTGLNDLLVPALDELKQVIKALEEAKRTISETANQFEER